MTAYNVWVGGGEVRSNIETLELATEVAFFWQSRGYTDVQIEKVHISEEHDESSE